MRDHSNSEIRRRTFVDGTVHYGWQCVRCLASIPDYVGRTWVPRVEVTGDPPPWRSPEDMQGDLFGKDKP